MSAGDQRLPINEILQANSRNFFTFIVALGWRVLLGLVPLYFLFLRFLWWRCVCYQDKCDRDSYVFALVFRPYVKFLHRHVIGLQDGLIAFCWSEFKGHVFCDLRSIFLSRLLIHCLTKQQDGDKTISQTKSAATSGTWTWISLNVLQPFLILFQNRRMNARRHKSHLFLFACWFLSGKGRLKSHKTSK